MPITHVYYLAGGLWLLGLAGVLLRADGRGRAAAVAVMLAGPVALLIGAGRSWGSGPIHGLAALLATLSGVYAVVLATLEREEA